MTSETYFEQTLKSLERQFPKKMSLNRRETAKALGIAVSTLDLRIKDGRDLPSFVKIGSTKNSRLVFTLTSIGEYLTNARQKVCIDCLSFEEANIEFNKKIEIMNEFERLIFNNAIDEYNILWVEHSDKGRLELNFAIPKINLKNKKNFNPYWYKKDFYKVDYWQNSINLRFGFSNPKDPKKSIF